MTRLKILIVAMALIGSIASLWVVRTGAQAVNPIIIPIPKNVYSVKFLCGKFFPEDVGEGPSEGPVMPGNYQTAINIHNPNFSPVTFTKKAIMLFANDPTFQRGFEVPRKPGQVVKATLESGAGMEIDCADIRLVLLKGIAPPNPFDVPAFTLIKGWVMIEVPGVKQGLDIVTAYTAHGFKQNPVTGVNEQDGFSFEIERATPTLVFP